MIKLTFCWFSSSSGSSSSVTSSTSSTTTDNKSTSDPTRSSTTTVSFKFELLEDIRESSMPDSRSRSPAKKSPTRSEVESSFVSTRLESRYWTRVHWIREIKSWNNVRKIIRFFFNIKPYTSDKSIFKIGFYFNVKFPKEVLCYLIIVAHLFASVSVADQK